MGGYIVGGGHGPHTRNIGYGADNLVGATLVTADGSVAELRTNYTKLTDFNGTVQSINQANKHKKQTYAINIQKCIISLFKCYHLLLYVYYHYSKFFTKFLFV